MEKVFFGKFKGQNLEDIIATDQGRKWAEWVINQPLERNEYYDKNVARNKKWKEILEVSIDPTVKAVTASVGGSISGVSATSTDDIMKVILELLSINKELIAKFDTLSRLCARQEIETTPNAGSETPWSE